MISNYSVKKPFTVFVAVILIILLGFISFTNMTTDLLPKMDLPYALILTTYVGASPEKVETTITKPIEQSMATVSNVKNISSVSSENSSMVILEFSNGVNMDSALIELNGKLDLIKAAWKDDAISAPVVSKINPNMLAVMTASIDVKNMDNAQIKEFVSNNILPELERIEGVASVSTSGMIEEQIEIKLNQGKIDTINEKLVDSVNNKLSKTGNELKNAKAQIEQGKQQLAKQQTEQMEKLSSGLSSIKTGIVTISKTETELKDKEEKLNFTQTAIIQSISGMDSLLTKMNKEKEELESIGNNLTQEQKVKLETLNSNINRIEQLKQENVFKLSELQKQNEQVVTGKNEIIAKKTALQEQEKELENAKSLLTSELSKASSELEKGEQELNKGIQEFELARDKALKNASIDGIITESMISNILMANNFSMPAGYIENTNDKMLIKVGEKFEDIDEIKNLTILSFDIEGLEKIRLEDLADIGYTDNSDEVYAKVNGNNAIVLSFQKQSTASTAEVCKDITAKMEKLEQNTF